MSFDTKVIWWCDQKIRIKKLRVYLVVGLLSYGYFLDGWLSADR